MSKTKHFGEVSIVTSMGSDQYIPLTDANGNITRITKDNLLASLIGDHTLSMMSSGVYILFCTSQDPKFVPPERWSEYSANGALGVVVVEGGRNLVIALDEPAAGTMYWNSAAGLCGTANTSWKSIAVDLDGESKTAAIMASANYEQSNPGNYAVGYCNQYSCFKSTTGYGISAGKWWLPSMGELIMMYSNFDKINYALSVAGGAALQRADYWSSSESSSTYAWSLDMTYGRIGYGTKASYLHRVRPVSALLQLTLQS
ncbi:MAG: hypothetical protein LUE27_07060 [Clostridia bacterium]|nr:hypothetical protein [Clostridia bacterium]